MTRQFRVALFLHVLNSLLPLGVVASQVFIGQTQLDANHGPIDQAQENIALPADLTMSDDGETLLRGETLPDFTSPEQLDVAIIDQTGRLMRSHPAQSALLASSPEQAKQAPDPHWHKVATEPASKTAPAPAPATKTASAPAAAKKATEPSQEAAKAKEAAPAKAGANKPAWEAATKPVTKDESASDAKKAAQAAKTTQAEAERAARQEKARAIIARAEKAENAQKAGQANRAEQADQAKSRAEAVAANKVQAQGNQTQVAAQSQTDNFAFHSVALMLCITALALIVSLQANAQKRARAPSQPQPEGNGDDVALGGSSTETTPPSGNPGGDRRSEARGTGNANKSGALTNEDALQGLLFLAVVLFGIGSTRHLVCDVFKLQCDERYTMQLFFRQDFHKVVLDMFFLFIIGRLAATSPLPFKSVAFAAVVLVSALMPSFLNEMNFMKHSLSMYDMSCYWTAMTWVVALVYVSFILSVAALHLHHFVVACGGREKLRAVAEVVVIFCIFVLPRAFEAGFHMHHWFVVWLLALTFRLPTLWSRAVQAMLIGGYINGIAVYGRDPVLACEAAYDLAYSEQCKFLTLCTWNTPSGPAPPTYMAPDWRTCSAANDYAF